MCDEQELFRISPEPEPPSPEPIFDDEDDFPTEQDEYRDLLDDEYIPEAFPVVQIEADYDDGPLSGYDPDDAYEYERQIPGVTLNGGPVFEDDF